MSQEPVFLYVEDDPRSRSIMELMICRVMGYQYLALFEDSENFLDRVTHLPKEPDVFLLDIQLYPHDGIELLQMLRSHPAYKNKMVVAVTASVTKTEVENLHYVGFDGCISKPLDRETFPGLIERTLNHEAVWFIQ